MIWNFCHVCDALDVFYYRGSTKESKIIIHEEIASALVCSKFPNVLNTNAYKATSSASILTYEVPVISRKLCIADIIKTVKSYRILLNQGPPILTDCSSNAIVFLEQDIYKKSINVSVF